MNEEQELRRERRSLKGKIKRRSMAIIDMQVELSSMRRRLSVLDRLLDKPVNRPK